MFFSCYYIFLWLFHHDLLRQFLLADGDLDGD